MGINEGNKIRETESSWRQKQWTVLFVLDSEIQAKSKLENNKTANL